ncbi:YkgJ family cysteine cluster protein [Candidatus Woesearchaeota archaeon]|nr:YkgJ family cysteine cluster protein [Candidatus Woesearchaeota archaeon]
MFPKKEKFKCKRCGFSCMQIVVLSDKEIEEIKKATNLPEEEFVDEDSLGRKRLKIINYYCYFLTIDKGIASCKIYAHRPEVCRKYPFFDSGTSECYPPRIVAFKEI